MMNGDDQSHNPLIIITISTSTACKAKIEQKLYWGIFNIPFATVINVQWKT